MVIRDSKIRNSIKAELLELLKQEYAFWSYAPESVSVDTIDDYCLIAMTMRYLDLPEIARLFSLYSKDKIKKAWKDILVPEGDYLYTLNRFFAWYYFNAKNPDAYLKNIQTRQLNQLFGA